MHCIKAGRLANKENELKVFNGTTSTFARLSILSLLLASILCSVSLEALSQATKTSTGTRPNIIIIQADDLGYGDLSCYGQKQFNTPHLDRMATEGVRFTNYYSGSTVCAPSRAALMTGMHTGHAHIRGNGEFPLLGQDVTVAKVLKSAGYRTAVIGKWGLGLADNSGRPDRQGFDESFGFLDHRHAHRQYTDHLWKNGERVAVDPQQDYVNDLFTQASLKFIEANKGNAFFIYLNYTVPHAELHVPEDSLNKFKGKFPEQPHVNAPADGRLAGGYRSQSTPRAAFAAMITRMDESIGRILTGLERHDLDENTIIFFTSDNGPHKEGGADPEFFNSNGQLRGIKRDLYEGGIRVPMIVRWAGRIKRGRVSDQVWSHWDILPTAAALAKAPVPLNIDGISMMNALLGKRQRGHDFLYWEFHERGFDQAVRMGQWKAVRHGLNQPLELYNLRNDIGEQTNVAGKHSSVVAKIEAYLKRARTESERWKVKL